MNANVNRTNRARLNGIRRELFDMANSYAGDKYGYIACRLHGISNSVYSIRDVIEVLYPLENTPPEPQHGTLICELPAPKPLAQYLDEYLEAAWKGTIDCAVGVNGQQLLEQALEAYQSTENVVIQIIKKKAGKT